MNRGRKILLVSPDPGQLAAWAKALQGAALPCVLLSELTETTTGASQLAEIGVVVSSNPSFVDQGLFPSQRRERGEVGLILCGISGPADVQLPADATPRELVLACKLLLQIVGLRHSVGRQQRQGRVLRELAATDALTGLANRRGWDDMLEQLELNAEATTPRVLLLLDIDGFKQWNDQQGHAVADRHLVAIAQRLIAATRRGDFLARWGGDEFALVLNNLQPDSAAAVVERIRTAASGIVSEATEAVTLSAGWALLNLGGDRPIQTAFERADAALREAKTAGRGCSRAG